MQIRQKQKEPQKLSGRFREQFVRCEVRQRNLDSGGGSESEGQNARQSSGGKIQPRYNVGEQEPRRTSNPDDWRTAENYPIRRGESLQNTDHTGINSLAMVG